MTNQKGMSSSDADVAGAAVGAEGAGAPNPAPNPAGIPDAGCG